MVSEFNLPRIRVNLELVASWDPSVLVLNSSSTGNDEAPLKRAKFRYSFSHGNFLPPCFITGAFHGIPYRLKDIITVIPLQDYFGDQKHSNSRCLTLKLGSTEEEITKEFEERKIELEAKALEIYQASDADIKEKGEGGVEAVAERKGAGERAPGREIEGAEVEAAPAARVEGGAGVRTSTALRARVGSLSEDCQGSQVLGGGRGSALLRSPRRRQIEKGLGKDPMSAEGGGRGLVRSVTMGMWSASSASVHNGEGETETKESKVGPIASKSRDGGFEVT
ncbi:hypothetical protein ZIOFF_048791 [Zingiber officinale]|uniref:Uncharacterized protein n=1 Tax=Zingiber officinale TaxID=94328 RepID=A0A8J5KWZ6_ZINOF|nr:hypothetical protein ZIOFF_048791 [Zingiber officinale]